MSNSRQSEPAPTRPTWKMGLIGLVAVLAAYTAYHWSDISANAQVQHIEHVFGVG